MALDDSIYRPDPIDHTWMAYGSVVYWDTCLQKARQEDQGAATIMVYEACLAEAVKRELNAG